MRSSVGVFGTTPNVDTQSEAELLQAELRIADTDFKGRPVDFLVDRERVHGPLASQYRGVGIFLLVPGVDDVAWVNGYKDAAAAMELLKVEEDVARGRAPESALRDVMPGPKAAPKTGPEWGGKVVP